MRISDGAARHCDAVNRSICVWQRLAARSAVFKRIAVVVRQRDPKPDVQPDARERATGRPAFVWRASNARQCRGGQCTRGCTHLRRATPQAPQPILRDAVQRGGPGEGDAPRASEAAASGCARSARTYVCARRPGDGRGSAPGDARDAGAAFEFCHQRVRPAPTPTGPVRAAPVVSFRAAAAVIWAAAAATWGLAASTATASAASRCAASTATAAIAWSASSGLDAAPAPADAAFQTACRRLSAARSGKTEPAVHGASCAWQRPSASSVGQ